MLVNSCIRQLIAECTMAAAMAVVKFLFSFAVVSANQLISSWSLDSESEGIYSVSLISANTGETLGAATILNNEWLISSGFHGYLYNPDDIIIDVRYGMISPAELIILHPKFTWNTWDYNLSLIKLREKIDLGDSGLRAVSWPLFLYSSAITAITYKVDEEHLAPTQVTILDDSICERQFGYSYEMNAICVNSSTGALHIAVPGAGLIHQGHLLGVFTNQFHEYLQNTLVYVNTATVQDWVRHTILLRSRRGQNDDTNSPRNKNIHKQPFVKSNTGRESNQINKDRIIDNNKNHENTDFYVTEDENDEQDNASAKKVANRQRTTEVDTSNNNRNDENSKGNYNNDEHKYHKTKFLESNYYKNKIYTYTNNGYITATNENASAQIRNDNDVLKQGHEYYENKYVLNRNEQHFGIEKGAEHKQKEEEGDHNGDFEEGDDDNDHDEKEENVNDVEEEEEEDDGAEYNNTN